MKRVFVILVVICISLFPSVVGYASPLLKEKADWQKSPYTGYTREHWLEITEQIIAGVLNYVDPETGIFDLPQSTGAYSELEDFRNENQVRIMERIMVGPIIYTVATGKDEIPGHQGSIIKPFINAIISINWL